MQRQLTRAILRLPNTHGRPLTVRCSVPIDSPEDQALEVMSDQGWARLHSVDKLCHWSITRKGAAAALEPEETLERVEFPKYEKEWT